MLTPFHAYNTLTFALYNAEVTYVKIRILDILKEKGKTKYWLYMQLGLSYQNFNKLVNGKASAIKFENVKSLCDILECTPNDLFEEYHEKNKKEAPVRLFSSLTRKCS